MQDNPNPDFPLPNVFPNNTQPNVIPVVNDRNLAGIYPDPVDETQTPAPEIPSTPLIATDTFMPAAPTIPTISPIDPNPTPADVPADAPPAEAAPSTTPEIVTEAKEKPIVSEEKPTEPKKEKKKSRKAEKEEENDDTEAEALAKKFAKSRVENLNVKPAKVPDEEGSRKTLIITICAILFVIVGGIFAYYHFVYEPEQARIAEENARREQEEAEKKAKEQVPLEEAVKEPEVPKFYSTLSGEEIASESENSNPTYCIQIPNGVDGARPQVGLQDAKIIFEAIAESGITRFAAIYQNPPSVVGPIRSLRLYYLNWDVPFNCTVVHAGGSFEAIDALANYGTRELDESTDYMWRSSNNYTVQRLWNNLFTSNEYLDEYNKSKGYLTSDIKSFPRFTPSAAARNKVDVQIVERLKIDSPSTKDTSTLESRINHIVIRFGAIPNFNPVYDYDVNTNTYKRSYETGIEHMSYDCSEKSGEITPELVCPEEQLAPSVVIAMIVQERKASYDNYHEEISTLGAGDAYVFQNGGVIKATWEKSSKDAQIIFRNEAGEQINLIPGQVWISAIPASYSGAGINFE